MSHQQNAEEYNRTGLGDDESAPLMEEPQPVVENADEGEEVFLGEKPAAAAPGDDRFVRLMADFDNFRRRTARESVLERQRGRREAVEKLLPVFDSIAMGLLSNREDNPYRAGMEAVLGQLLAAFESLGVQKIPTRGEPFDPNLHEAIGYLPNDSHAAGIVCEESRAGFTDEVGLVRAAQVLVSSGPAGGGA